MKKAVIYYSKTGNTEGVAKQISEKHTLELHAIKAHDDDPYQKHVTLTQTPNPKPYDYLIFAGPVHAFSISKIMKTYLNQIEDLSGKTIDLFITHHFPYAWLGGHRTLRQMKRMIKRKQGEIRWMTSINWSSKNRDATIENLIKSSIIKDN